MMDVQARNRIDQALFAERPDVALADVAEELIQLGVPRARVLQVFEELRAYLRSSHRAGEDVVLDVMDRVAGFCAPHMRI